jgi:hypothetical protein
MADAVATRLKLARPEFVAPSVALAPEPDDEVPAPDGPRDDDDPDEPDEPALAPTDRFPALDPAPAEPPPAGAGACTDGTDGVDTVGVRTGGTLGTGTGGGPGLGTETVRTVGVGSEGVETVGVGREGVETVGVATRGVETVGVGSEGVLGTVRAELKRGCIPSNTAASPPTASHSPILAAFRRTPLNRLSSRIAWPLQCPRMSSYTYPLLMIFIRTQTDSLRGIGPEVARS